MRRKHTNERLIEHQILKLEDQLKIAELELIWRIEKNKAPIGLRSLLTSCNNLNLRNRSFIRERNWKQDLISYRLASRATKEIQEIESAKSKKGLTNKYKKMLPSRIPFSVQNSRLVYLLFMRILVICDKPRKS